METAELIKQLYPNVYETASKLYTFERKIHELIDDTYGKDTFNSILKLNEFHQEIDNVQQNKLSETQMNKLAQKFSKYFDAYSLATYELKTQIGAKDTLSIMEFLRDYFKSAV
jgi:hypothetical protein